MKCPICDSNSELKIVKANLVFRKEKFRIHKHFYECESCKEKFSTTELDNLNLQQVYNQYREKHNIPFPEQLINLRKNYGLSAKKMAEVLGFGVNIYRNYEIGEVPNISNGTLLNVILEPRDFLRIVKQKESLFKPKQFGKAVLHLKNLISEQKDKRYSRDPKDLFWNNNLIPNEYTGYIVPSLEKLANMVIYFLESNKNLFKVKLNKLLYYSDFCNFKRSGYSISGYQYKAIQMGPVPLRYDIVYNLLWELGYINFILAEIDDNRVEQPVADKPFDEKLFSEDELESLNDVNKKFKSITTNQLVNLSHKEKGWIEEVERKGIISYLKYGFELKI